MCKSVQVTQGFPCLNPWIKGCIVLRRRIVALIVGSHGCRFFQDGSMIKMNISFIDVRSPVTKCLEELGWEASSSSSSSCCSSSSSSCCGPNEDAKVRGQSWCARKLPSWNWKRGVCTIHDFHNGRSLGCNGNYQCQSKARKTFAQRNMAFDS